MFTELTNEDRAQRALNALIAWAGDDHTAQQLDERGVGNLGEDLLGEVVGDMLSDLMHLIHLDTTTETIDDLVERGRSHFDDELLEGWLGDRVDELVLDEHPRASVCYGKKDGRWIGHAELPDGTKFDTDLGVFDPSAK